MKRLINRLAWRIVTRHLRNPYLRAHATDCRIDGVDYIIVRLDDYISGNKGY